MEDKNANRPLNGFSFSDISENIQISPLDIFEYFGNAKRPIREGTE